MSAVLEARVVALEARLAAVESRLSSVGSGSAPAGGGSNIGPNHVASDRALDSQYGDPVIKKDPKRWLEQGGESFAGSTMSQCPSAYLEEFASLQTWMADKDDEQGKTYTNKKTGKVGPASAFARNQASLARGWARRNQGKAAAPAQPDFGANENDANDDIPF